MQDIHGIRPPVMVGTDPAVVKLALMIGAGALAVLVLFLVVRRFLKRRRQGDIPELIPAVPPYLRAVRELEGMTAAPVHDPRAFYFRLGRTVKAYMGEVFQRNCLEMTTPELARTVKGSDLPHELKRGITRFQEVCDPFRYAPLAPAGEQVQADLSRAKDLVERIEAERTKDPEEAAS